MAEPLPVTWVVEADLDRDGAYETPLTSYINAAGSGIEVARELDEDGRYKVSRVTFDLANQYGDLTPEYVNHPNYAGSSPFANGKMRAGSPVRITATHNAIGYTLWTGYTAEWVTTGGRGEPTGGRCRLSCTDLAGLLREALPVDVTPSTSRDTDGAIAAILAATGLSAGDYSLDDGLQDLPLHYVAQQNPLDAVNQAVDSEMGGRWWINAAGQLRFRSRQGWLGTTPDDTWGDGTSIKPEALGYELVNRHLISSASVQANVFVSEDPDEVVMAFSRNELNGNSVLIAAGETRDFGRIPYGKAVIAAITPVAMTDYRGNSAAGGGGSDATNSLTVTFADFGASCDLQVKNTSGVGVYLTWFQVRGTPYSVVLDRPVFTAAKTTPGEKLKPGGTVNLPYPDDRSARAKDYAWHLLHQGRHEYPRITLDFAWDANAIIAAMLGVELGARILFADRLAGSSGQWGTYVSDWWYVVAIRHRLHPTTVKRTSVELVPSYLFRNLDRIAYDLFDRADQSGLGTSTSGDTWASSAINVVSGVAAPQSAARNIATITI